MARARQSAPQPTQLTTLLREYLPPKLLEIADVVGLEAAIRLAEHWPGIRLFVPQRMHLEHPIALAIGVRSAECLSATYGGETVCVPKAQRYLRAIRNAEIVRRYQAGESAAALAREYGIHENHIYALVAQSQAEQQGDLFQTQAQG